MLFQIQYLRLKKWHQQDTPLLCPATFWRTTQFTCNYGEQWMMNAFPSTKSQNYCTPRKYSLFWLTAELMWVQLSVKRKKYKFIKREDDSNVGRQWLCNISSDDISNFDLRCFCLLKRYRVRFPSRLGCADNVSLIALALAVIAKNWYSAHLLASLMLLLSLRSQCERIFNANKALKSRSYCIDDFKDSSHWLILVHFNGL